MALLSYQQTYQQKRIPATPTWLVISIRFCLVVSLATVWVVAAGWSSAWARPLAQNSGTQVRGEIAVDTTWTVEKSPYQVTGLLRVLPGATLTIQPGVVVEVANAVPLSIDGALIAEGTPNQPILFTGASKTRGAWNGIIVGNSADSPALLSFRHVTVEYGSLVNRYNGGNLEIEGWATVIIEQSTFRQSGANGINVASNGSLQISDTAFLDNQLAAIRLAGSIPQGQEPLFSHLRAEGNGTNAILYSSVTLGTGTYTLSQPGPNLPYRMQGGYAVSKDAHLIVQPGVEMQIDTGFNVYGELTALGSAEQPIRFTHTGSEAANWWGLNVSGTYEQLARAQLDYVIVEYGGQPNGIGDGNLIVKSAIVTVTHSIVRAGGNSGITNHGGLPNQPYSFYMADTEISGNYGAAIRCTVASCHQTLLNLTANDNGFDGFAQQSALSEDTIWANIGLPYLVDQYSGIVNSNLTIEAGVEIRFSKDAQFLVRGNLIAAGTPTQPVIFTGTEQQPGWWKGIRVSGMGTVLDLRYCEIGYGGASLGFEAAALLTLEIPAAFVSDCRLHHSAGPAIRTYGEAMPVIQRSRFEENAFGVENAGGTGPNFVVDARYNWWGAASGPSHDSNPNGTGAAVSDQIRFDPWLSSPDQAVASELEVTIGGVERYVPGRTVPYSIHYNNFSGQTLKDAVLRVALPANSDYVDSTGGGIFWPDRRQVFWKLGNVASGGSGYFVVNVKYDWGLPNGLNAMIAAQLTGSNVTPQPFDIAAYLDYQPRFVTDEVELSKEQVDIERAANPDLNAIYTLADNEGYSLGSALQQSYNTGDVVKQTILIKFQPQTSAFFLWSQAGSATGVAVDGSSFTVHRSGGALRYELQTESWNELPTTEAIVAGSAWNDCMANCIEEKVPGFIAKKYIKIVGTLSKVVSCIAAANTHKSEDIASCTKLLGKAIPGYGEAVDLGLCNKDCLSCEAGGEGCNDESCHCCAQDKYRCSDDDWLYSKLGGRDVIKIKRCNPVTNKYFAEEVYQVCASCDKCIVAANGPVCMPENTTISNPNNQLQTATAEMTLLTAPYQVRCAECSTARDPNEMHGPTGDLLPGQLLTYTIDYENVGAGEAYGVFVVNQLSEHLDLATLQLPDEAIWAAASRTIYFPVGELAPKGEAGSAGKITYSVRLMSGLPSGTVITNQAIVHFPSVPEETPTNVVINTVQPIALTSLALETAFEQPIAIQLRGQDVSNKPLTFAISDGLLYGRLTGTLPNLTYQPAPGFTGLDRFVFTASNGTETSRPAEVTILVGANTNDSKPPTVLWTAPNDGAVVGPSLALATGSDALYTPRLQIQFSEAMDVSTVTSATIQLQDSNGRTLPIFVNYDPSVDQAVVLLQEPIQAEKEYMVIVMGAAADLAGNPLGAAYQWRFDTGDSPTPTKLLFLPAIQQ